MLSRLLPSFSRSSRFATSPYSWSAPSASTPGDDRIATLDGNTTSTDHAYLVHAANVLPELVSGIENAIEALYNVPEVGRKYDQQHSDTHLAAAVDLKELLTKAQNVHTDKKPPAH
ncbi:exported hypothetical protein [Verrucomicrobia bacterium]|nr:exported hypothetical protein [Verrucomicrobiota bacterium]